MSYGAAATNLVMMQKQTTLLPKTHGDIVVALLSCAQLCSAILERMDGGHYNKNVHI